MSKQQRGWAPEGRGSRAVEDTLTLAPAIVHLLEFFRVDSRKLFIAAVAIQVRLLVCNQTITLLIL